MAFCISFTDLWGPSTMLVTGQLHLAQRKGQTEATGDSRESLLSVRAGSARVVLVRMCWLLT